MATHTYTDRQTDTHGQTDTHTYTHTYTDRQTHRQTDRQTDRQTHTHTHTHTLYVCHVSVPTHESCLVFIHRVVTSAAILTRLVPLADIKPCKHHSNSTMKTTALRL